VCLFWILSNKLDLNQETHFTIKVFLPTTFLQQPNCIPFGRCKVRQTIIAVLSPTQWKECCKNLTRTRVNFCREWSTGHELFVEGDVYDVICALERDEAHDEPGRSLRMHLGWDVAAPRADRDLKVALACKDVHSQMIKH